jgi:hypothetical protein
VLVQRERGRRRPAGGERRRKTGAAAQDGCSGALRSRS